MHCPLWGRESSLWNWKLKLAWDLKARDLNPDPGLERDGAQGLPAMIDLKFFEGPPVPMGCGEAPDDVIVKW